MLQRGSNNENQEKVMGLHELDTKSIKHRAIRRFLLVSRQLDNQLTGPECISDCFEKLTKYIQKMVILVVN